MRVMSAGDGYRYLLKSVVAADGDRALSTPLTRYYLEEGTPPGRWIGSGLSGFGRGDLKVGSRVSEEQLQRLVGQGRDPLTGAPLGRAYPQYGQVSTPADAAVEPTDVGSAEQWGSRRRAVAGYDFTFSVPKSASVLWAVGDADLQEAIVGAHHAAVADVLAFMERELAATRVGVSTEDGAVAQVPVLGLVATAFDHFDSRAGDPHLHTHVVISNKVRAVLDGRWRSLDGRPLHAATVALSELHEGLFADRIVRLLGVRWEARERGRERNPAWAIAAVPEELVQEFSSRSREIDVEKDRLIGAYVQQHGRRPSASTVIRLRQQATLATRPEKQVRSLADLTTEWRTRAAAVLSADATQWADRVACASNSPIPMGLLEEEDIAAFAERVVERVGERRSTWRRWNLYAEAARQTMQQRFGSTAERESVLVSIINRAERASVRLTPPEVASVPLEFVRSDGSSVFRAKDTTVFSSPAVLSAEDRLLALAEDYSGPTATPTAYGRFGRRGSVLDVEQVAAVTALVRSGAVVDLLVGPAGTGKTHTMSVLRTAWEAAHGTGSVVGLAPSATAAQVLGDELGIKTENTAMWLHLAQQGQTAFEAGQLVILDEASLAGTAALDRLARAAHEAGAKLLLVGDTDQLSAVEAGGAFAMLAAARGDALVELKGVRRFTAAWERAASLQLRDGDPAVLGIYVEHGRVVGGDADAVLETAYEAWRRDVQKGRSSVLIAGDAATVIGLNERARADLILAGRVQAADGVELHDCTSVSKGDVIVTRRNDRRLRTRRGWVRNGTRWRVRDVWADGSLLVQALEARRGGRILLPGAYVREHVELGYAVTPYRVQGLTADTGHFVVNSRTTREQLYVGMTRGRLSNTAHVALDHSDDAHSTRHPADEPTRSARDVLAAVLQHVGAEPSAHATIVQEQERWGSIAQLAAEYETIAAAAQRPRWSAVVRSSGLSTTDAEAVIGSAGFGPLCGSLRRAEALDHDAGTLLARVVRLRDLTDAQDPAAVLHARLERATASRVALPRPNHFIAGLIPPVLGATTPEMDLALKDRQKQIQQRAESLLDTAIDCRETWVVDLSAGNPQLVRHDPTWRSLALTVTAFLDRYASSVRERGFDQSIGSCASPSDATLVEHATGAARARAQLFLQIPDDDHLRPTPRASARANGPARR